jgi:hypothetical protein
LIKNKFLKVFNKNKIKKKSYENCVLNIYSKFISSMKNVYLIINDYVDLYTVNLLFLN